MNISSGDKSASTFIVGAGVSAFAITALMALLAAQLLMVVLVVVLIFIHIKLYNYALAQDNRNLLRLSWIFPFIVWAVAGSLSYLVI
jgi:hypothetical protein